tara:strand:+ start:468 stop:695 length:228 start_codon:yes stop_codon:yes gene_type:complete
MKEVLEQAIKNILTKYKSAFLPTECVRGLITREIIQTLEKTDKKELISYSAKDSDATAFDNDWETDKPVDWRIAR